MLTLKERKKIQQLLPLNVSHGYNLIHEKLPHVSRNQISQAFTMANRYKPEVFDAALQVISEFNEKVKEQKESVKLLKTKHI